jgi:septal ring factor EnvC (AmiA/AmiB activator)
MTSVLYSAGLNYQGGNPIGNQVRSVQTSVTDLRKLIDAQTTDINLLKAQNAALDKDLKAATSAIAAINTKLNATTTPPTTTPTPAPSG